MLKASRETEEHMPKYIIDRPRKRRDGARLEHFTRMDREISDKPGAQSDAVNRAPRSRKSGEKLRRFTDLDRQSD